MLRIEKRTASFAGALNGRQEKHGDENIDAADIRVTMALPRGRDLANTLIGEAAEHLLWQEVGGALEPRYNTLGALPLVDRIEEAKVEIWPRGLDEGSLKLTDATLSRVKLRPLPGGVLELQFLLQVKPDAEGIAMLWDCKGRDVELKIDAKRIGSPVQKLPLDEPEQPKRGRRRGEQQQLDA